LAKWNSGKLAYVDEKMVSAGRFRNAHFSREALRRSRNGKAHLDQGVI
jgi:hypothetical protein